MKWLLKKIGYLKITFYFSLPGTSSHPWWKGARSGSDECNVMILCYSTQCCIEYVMKLFRCKMQKIMLQIILFSFGAWIFLLSNHSYILHEKGCGNRTMRPMIWVHKRILYMGWTFFWLWSMSIMTKWGQILVSYNGRKSTFETKEVSWNIMRWKI